MNATRPSRTCCPGASGVCVRSRRVMSQLLSTSTAMITQVNTSVAVTGKGPRVKYVMSSGDSVIGVTPRSEQPGHEPAGQKETNQGSDERLDANPGQEVEAEQQQAGPDDEAYDEQPQIGRASCRERGYIRVAST